jgi:hypothetical protein
MAMPGMLFYSVPIARYSRVGGTPCIFFTNRKLLIAEYLSKGMKHNQGYFISDILPELEREEMRFKRTKQSETFHVHMYHSKTTMVAKSMKISIGKDSYAVLVHLILLI